MKSAARILIVDDDDHVRETLVDELSADYDVDSVGGANEAFDSLSLNRYDVVISDFKMPEHDGIEVLDFVRIHQPDAVRVLLTGYVDERAHRALLAPDAPYKVGKPWHDEIEVVVRRGLEQRAIARNLSASVDDALRLARFDDELGGATSSTDLTDVVLRRTLTVDGVTACGATTRVNGVDKQLTGSPVCAVGDGWYLDLPLDEVGDLRLKARGTGDSARQIVSYMADRARRRCGILEPPSTALHVRETPTTRLGQLVRQATVGAMTGALLHDLASTMQTLSSSLSEIAELAHGQPELLASTAEATFAGTEAIQLFVQMRAFIRAGKVPSRQSSVSSLVSRAFKLAGSYVRERATLVVRDSVDTTVMVPDALFLQVLSNVLRNAANASPRAGVVEISHRIVDGEVQISITDDGPGVAPQIADYMFEPFASSSQDGTGLGLATSAYVMSMIGGRISYRKHPERGACFTVSLPVAAQATVAVPSPLLASA